jgi:hypothetical protein
MGTVSFADDQRDKQSQNHGPRNFRRPDCPITVAVSISPRTTPPANRNSFMLRGCTTDEFRLSLQRISYIFQPLKSD